MDDAPFRILICTIPFDIGIDFLDVCEVIHWGPPSDVESYIQGCGEARRITACQPANALLFWKIGDL